MALSDLVFSFFADVVTVDSALYRVLSSNTLAFLDGCLLFRNLT